MERFNRWNFEAELVEAIENEVINGNIQCDDGIQELVINYIETETIYYSTCFEIIQELGITNWSDLVANYGEMTDICKVAFYGLYEYIWSESDVIVCYDTLIKQLEKEGKIELNEDGEYLV